MSARASDFEIFNFYVFFLGKRTIIGMLLDGYHSVKRYYLNNFTDGYLQDAFNLFLGHYSVFEIDGSPKKFTRASASDSALRSKFLPVVFAFATSMSVLCLIFPGGNLLKLFYLLKHVYLLHTKDLWSERLMYFLFWGTASVVSALTIYTFGEDFVNKPRFPME
ncbi:unnamed protein product [Schistocephalus solidus]|uniref:Dolichyl-P-Glc:Glc(2)Man(9)GlcNAc(2)-PP-dolichol alpha-1,2-glucosyltransferase n=1 Tax=Schistocephalus solidus TaxID=70667 RepID=A0A183SLC9_SCHSO|nr:unnamed protein product [Schistocephalus solidus]